MSAQKNFICNWSNCQKVFITKAGLTKHNRLHTGQRPFACKFEGCNKAFVCSSTLATHRRTHNGQKPYVCDFTGCTKAFTTSSSLTVHKRRHANDRPFSCDVTGCDKRFVVRSLLLGHQQTHTTPQTAVNEEYRDVPGSLGYQVSNLGRVRNSRNMKGLVGFQLSSGYIAVGLSGRQFLVHRLVMIAFVGPVPKDYTVDHIDRNRSNNILSNLRYATSQQQQQNKSRPIRQPVPVERFDTTGRAVSYNNVREAAENLHLGRISLAYAVSKIRDAIRRGVPYQMFTWRRVQREGNRAWRDIPPELLCGHEGYAVSTLGEIKFPNGRVTLGSLDCHGYFIVTIQHKRYRVHRLTAATFLPPARRDQTVVNHLNGIRADNRVENLEFATYGENSRHAHRTGLIKTRRPVKQFTLAGMFVKDFRSMSEALKSLPGAKSSGSISSCCNGKARTAYGFMWKYCDSQILQDHDRNDNDNR